MIVGKRMNSLIVVKQNWPDSSRQKIAESNRNRGCSEETRNKLRMKRYSLETKRKISITSKGRKH